MQQYSFYGQDNVNSQGILALFLLKTSLISQRLLWHYYVSFF